MSVRINLKNIIPGFNQDAMCARHGCVANFGYWTHIEIFWNWFKKLRDETWLPEEQHLRRNVEMVTDKHYPEMDGFEVTEEVKMVLATFLFDWGHMSTVEVKRFERFTKYILALQVALAK